MVKKELSLSKTTWINVMGLLLVQGVSFFTTPVFSRIMGANNFGIYSTFIAWQNIFVIILPLSVGSTIGLAINEFSEDEYPKYLCSIFTMGVITTLLFSAIIIVMSNYFSNLLWMSKKLLLCLLASTLVAYMFNYSNTRYIYMLQANKNLILSMVFSVLSVGISFIILSKMPSENNYWGRILGLLIAYTIMATIIMPPIYSSGRVLIKLEHIRFCLPLSIPVVFHALSNIVLNESDRIMLRVTCSESMAGIYSLAYGFASIMVIVYDVLNKSWAPFYYKYLKDDDADNLAVHANNYIYLYTFVTVGFLLVYKELFSFYADNTYKGGAVIIPIIIVGIYFMFIYSFAINYEFYIKQTGCMAIITASAAVINVILNYVLIKKFDMMGAAVATLVSYFYEFIAHYVYVKNLKDGKFPFTRSFYLKPFAILGFGIIIYYIFLNQFVLRWSIAGAIALYLVFSIKKRGALF